MRVARKRLVLQRVARLQSKLLTGKTSITQSRRSSMNESKTGWRYFRENSLRSRTFSDNLKSPRNECMFSNKKLPLVPHTIVISSVCIFYFILFCKHANFKTFLRLNITGHFKISFVAFLMKQPNI